MFTTDYFAGHDGPAATAPKDGQSVILTGVVEKLWCSKPDFSAGLLATPDRHKHKVRGRFYCNVGACIVVEGKWADDPTYGVQIDVKSFAYAQESGSLDKEGLAHYLASSPDFKGIGPMKAKLLADKYGDDFGGALNDRPEEMASHAKLPVEALLQIRKVWEANRTKNGLAAWLGQWGLSHSQTQKIIGAFGDSARKALEEDPYVLIDRVDGFGWATVDGIAMRMGITKEHPGRIRAAIIHAVTSQLDDGSTWTHREQVVRLATELLFLDAIDAASKVGEALGWILTERVNPPLVSDGDRIAVTAVYKAELGIFGWLAEARSAKPRAVAPSFGVKDNAGQRAAIEGALASQASVITGGAGVGKTYAIASIIRALKAEGYRKIAMCAFAGKAARRMTESIREYGIQADIDKGAIDPFTGEEVRPDMLYCEGQTIHRLLRYSGEGRFFYHEDLKLPVDVVIIDEISMVASELLWRLLQAIDPAKTRVIFVGDQFQLPPIGGGNPLRDILAHGLLPVFYLTEVMRQAGELKERCSAVLRGIVEPHRPTALEAERQSWYLITPQRHESAEAVQATLLDLLENRVLKLRLAVGPFVDGEPVSWRIPDLLRDVQVITPVHKGVIGTVELNAKIQMLVQRVVYGVAALPPRSDQRPKPMVGDKVIQVKNNYKLGVMNGTLGIVKDIAREAYDEPTAEGKRKVKAGDLFVLFDGETRPTLVSGENKSDVQVAYALSVHKMQGSEVPIAIVIASKSHAFSQSRSMLYTAVTRARQIAILIGDSWGVQHAASRVVVDSRRTWLDAWSKDRLTA